MDVKKVRETIEDFKNLAELLQNKESPAVEHCNIAIEALEKQLPKKLIEHHYEEPGETPYIKYGCGNGCKMQPSRSSKYCNQCGQRIDWSE